MNKFTLPTGTTNRHQWHKQTLDAIRDLDRLRFQRRELYGVKGGEERESIISTMFAGTENPTAEALLHNAMHAFLQNRTTLIIAHRLSAVRQADRVLVFDAGKIIDEGNHQELISKDGLYRDLYGPRS